MVPSERARVSSNRNRTTGTTGCEYCCLIRACGGTLFDHLLLVASTPERSKIQCAPCFLPLPSARAAVGSYLLAVTLHRHHVPRLFQHLLRLLGRLAVRLDEENTCMEQPRLVPVPVPVLQKATGGRRGIRGRERCKHGRGDTVRRWDDGPPRIPEKDRDPTGGGSVLGCRRPGRANYRTRANRHLRCSASEMKDR